ncbi:hypothetical protein GCM10008967_13640 [Bacillus carboniphilus]|uniref:RsgI N-terminal anti-sigma domain-containing protein n=1 Tax=Bacillus carboniphilus TaxID=86663 RepID=A0ABP3FUR0_9BACI
MMKGIVMDVKGEKLTVLTKDGQFLQTDKNDYPQYEIGQEITIQSKVLLKERKRVLSFPKPILAVASVFVLIFASFLLSFGFGNQTAYAYVTVDINPSFEIAIDEEFKIIDIVPLNNEAESILEDISNWEKQSFTKVTSILVKESKEEGFLNDEQTVIFSSVFVEEQEDTKEEMTRIIQEVQVEMEKEHVELTWYEGTEEDREQASQAGVSTGKLIESKKKENPKSQEETKDLGTEEEQDKEAKGNRGNKDDEKGNRGKSEDKPGNENKGQNKKEKEKEQKEKNNESEHPGKGNSKDPENKGNDNKENGKNKGNKGNDENKGDRGNMGNDEKKGNKGNKGNGEDKGNKGNNGNNENSNNRP